MTPAADLCLARGHNRLSALRRDFGEDMVRYLTKSPEDIARGDSFRVRLSAALTPDLLPILVYRVAHLFYAKGRRRSAALMARLNLLVHKLNIPAQSCIAGGCRIPHPVAVTFHGVAGRGLTLFPFATCCATEDSLEGPVEFGPRLGDDVTVGSSSTIVGPVTVGDGSLIGLQTHVTSDVPERVYMVAWRRRRVDARGRADAGEN